MAKPSTAHGKSLIEQARRRMEQENRVPSRLPHDDWSKDARDRLMRKDNAAEEHIKELLDGLPLNYVRERPIKTGGRRYFIDFLVTSFKDESKRGLKKARIAIEVDGGYHFTAEQQAKDREKDSALLRTARVWSILRIRASIAMSLSKDDLMALMQGHERGTVRFRYE